MIASPHRAKLASAAVIAAGFLIVGGCPQLAGSVSAPQSATFRVGFTRDNTIETFTTANYEGPVNPNKNTTIDILIYSVGPLSAGDLSINLRLVAGDTVAQEYDVTLEQTDFEELPASIPQLGGSLDGSKLDTRYVANMVVNCAACDANAAFPDSYYSWEATVERASGVIVSGTIDLSYSMYLGPILSE